MDSTMVLFDAKHTDKEKIMRSVVTEEQEECFERYMKLGAMCFLVVSIGLDKFYRVPWVVFRDMKKSMDINTWTKKILKHTKLNT